eukprot:bmy_02481T0
MSICGLGNISGIIVVVNGSNCIQLYGTASRNEPELPTDNDRAIMGRQASCVKLALDSCCQWDLMFMFKLSREITNKQSKEPRYRYAKAKSLASIDVIAYNFTQLYCYPTRPCLLVEKKATILKALKTLNIKLDISKRTLKLSNYSSYTRMPVVKQLVVDTNEKLPDGIPPAFILPLRSGKSLNTKVRFSSISYILPKIVHKFRISQVAKVACSNNYILQMQNTSFKMQASQKLANSYVLKVAETKLIVTYLTGYSYFLTQRNKEDGKIRPFKKIHPERFITLTKDSLEPKGPQVITLGRTLQRKVFQHSLGQHTTAAYNGCVLFDGSHRGLNSCKMSQIELHLSISSIHSSEARYFVIFYCQQEFQGFGVDQLRDDNLETYWQSDGSQPHLVNIQFRRKTTVKTLCIYADYKSDESYTPNSYAVFNSLTNLDYILNIYISEFLSDYSFGCTTYALFRDAPIVILQLLLTLPIHSGIRNTKHGHGIIVKKPITQRIFYPNYDKLHFNIQDGDTGDIQVVSGSPSRNNINKMKEMNSEVTYQRNEQRFLNFNI